jgi:transcriptional regulator with XRE-family HTH domain
MNEKRIETLRKKLLDGIKAHMLANNITQLEAAESCGWQQPTVARMLNGDYGPKLDHLLMLCEAVGMKLEVTSKMYKQSDEG